MPFYILVATPTAAFGDLIQNSLEESGRFQVHVASSYSAVRVAVEKNDYGIIVLDSDLEGEMRDLFRDLAARFPAVKIVMIPPENNPHHPLVEGLVCSAYLRKPFYLPDLMSLIDELSSDAPSAPPAADPGLGWLDSAAVEALASTSGARAALVSRPDGTAILGGALAESARGQLVELGVRFWQRPERTDQVRFARLEGDGQDVLIYLTAISLPGEVGLGLVFGGATPLSKVRAWSASFVRGLRDLAVNPHALTAAPATEVVVPADQARPAVPADQARPLVPSDQASPVVPEDLPEREIPDEEDGNDDAVLRGFNLTEMLGAIPAPDPNGKVATGKKRFSTRGWVADLNLARQDLLTSDDDEVENASAILPAQLPDDQTSRPESPDSGGLDADAPAYPNDLLWRWEPESAEDEDWVREPRRKNGGREGSGGEAPRADDGGQTSGLSLSDLPSQLFEPDEIFNQPLPTLKEEDEVTPPTSKVDSALPPPFEAFDWKTTARAASEAQVSLDAATPPVTIPAAAPDVPASAGPASVSSVQEGQVAETLGTNSSPAAGSADSSLNGADPSQSPAVELARPGDAPAELKRKAPILDNLISETALASLTGVNFTEEEDEADGSRSSLTNGLTSLDQLEASSAGISLINYTCILIPRIPTHYLTGEISERLSQWMQQLCLAFGWLLEGISLRPEYFQWTVQVTPAISPGNVIKIVRQNTSEHIFGQFERFRQQNPSGDFWANGYLIVSGSQPPSAQLLRDYISQTRRRQGLGRTPGDASPRSTL